MKKVILCIALLGLICCDVTWHDKLTGNYYLLAIASMSDMRVTYYPKNESMNFDITVDGGIYEVGYDENFILAKAYKVLTDSLGNSLHRYDTDITEYYIIPVDNTQSGPEAQENCFKLLTEKEFEAKRKELGVSDKLTFTETFEKYY